jgi:hypothetical protein
MDAGRATPLVVQSRSVLTLGTVCRQQASFGPARHVVPHKRRTLVTKVPRPVTWTAVEQLIASAASVKPPIVTSWGAVDALITSAYQDALPRTDRLAAALKDPKSAFGGLGEPLLLDLGTHRWLAEAREEAYSDWLAWTLEQLGTAKAVFQVLGIEQHSALQYCGDHCPVSSREVWMPQGRLDILMRFGTQASLVIEVKTRPPADLKNQLGLYRSYMTSIPGACPPGVLLWVADDSDTERNGCLARGWAGVCRRLRSFVATALLSKENQISAALILAFVSAVEQNLLGLSTHVLRAVNRKNNFLVSPSMTDRLLTHLRASTPTTSGG